MSQGSRWIVGLAAAAAALLMPIGLTATRSADGAAIAQQATSVPADLKPLLATPVSEMRLVVTRYNADRQTLIGDYPGRAGGGRGGGGGGRAGGGGAASAAGAAAGERPIQISPGRFARLKRYDLDWQEALKTINTATL